MVMKFRKILFILSVVLTLLLTGAILWFKHKFEKEYVAKYEKTTGLVLGVSLPYREPLAEAREEGFQDGFVFSQYKLDANELAKIKNAITTNLSLPNWSEAYAPYWKEKVGSKWMKGLILEKDLPLYICGVGQPKNSAQEASPIYSNFNQVASGGENYYTFVLHEKLKNESIDFYLIDEKGSQYFHCDGNF